jgi:murein DD-endopeptidase MepM/ murein hydrolase activator NlpD
MEFEREEAFDVEESPITEEPRSSSVWGHFLKQGVVCVIFLVTVLWLNKVAPDGVIGHIMNHFKYALKTDADSTFGYIRRQPIVDQIITWSKNVWREMEEQPVIADEMVFIPPVPGAVRKKFGWITDSRGTEPYFHPGVDLEAPENSPIRASKRGTVQEIREESDGKWRVTLDHAGKSRSIYANCHRVSVSIGDKVEVGQEIGIVGIGGDEGQTVHWEIWKGIQPVDPSPFVQMR